MVELNGKKILVTFLMHLGDLNDAFYPCFA